MKPILILVIFAYLLQGACIALPEDPADYAEWEARQLAAIEERKALPPEQAIPNLGKWVRKYSLNTHVEKGDRVVYSSARDLLLSIPGHAEWFGKEIKAMTDNEINRTGLQFEGGRGWYFQTLSHLQSPETVKVLGAQLFDERSPFEGPINEAEWMPSSCFAVISLHNLGLENPPVKSKNPDHRNDVRSWQLWFEQVRAGTRTFSFKGDKTIYSLAGPVSTALDPSEARPGSPQPGPDSASVSPGSSNLSVWIALSLAVMALILAAKFAFARKAA
ncbi:hypothetical protein OKA05_24065 [Luteolibacter arcticus]|uniref:Uncharacterized protein n=1 Tax=Luteolibacter arcticus TaxID=1581411 RepID=A0ABT3GQ64_9BACT|nr:hypothetical protein [Luteolibacter arcticus]MCW1925656.1 hypothetical protein [Luteolibacter arcticus]